MPVLELTDDQVATLKEHLERVLSDLSMEIAGTDSQEYRKGLKNERRLLKEVLDRLTGPGGQ